MPLERAQQVSTDARRPQNDANVTPGVPKWTHFLKNACQFNRLLWPSSGFVHRLSELRCASLARSTCQELALCAPQVPANSIDTHTHTPEHAHTHVQNTTNAETTKHEARSMHADATNNDVANAYLN